MKFRLLGPLEVTDRGGALAVTGRRRRELLLRLLTDANQPVSDDRLIFDLWGGTPSAGASSTLASHVSHLRQVLGRERLLRRAGGYLIVVGAGELDSAAFEAGLASAHQALRQGRTEQAVHEFERSLSHWSGAALSDVEGAEWARNEIARLDELRIGAVESLLVAQIALGRHEEIVAAAEAQVRTHPFREQGWATLMVALFRSGRQSEALRAYQRLRGLLAEELGVEPSRQLADLEEAILFQRSELPWSGGAEGRSRHRLDEQPRLELATVVAVGPADRERGWDAEAPPFLADVVSSGAGRLIGPTSGCALALFSSGVAAIEAAVSLQKLCAESGRSPLSIGISVGEVAVHPEGVAGDPIDEAVALAGRARPGEIVVTSQVGHLSARNSPYPIVRGARDRVDGGAPPTAALHVVWDSDTQSRELIPLVGALADSDPPFIGRATQRAELLRLTGAAERGERQVALISGEPGIGKSSLAASIARQVHGSDATVLFGRCLEVGHPYQPVTQALGYLVDHAAPELLALHVDEFGGDLSRLVPGLPHRLPGTPPPTSSDADTERFLAFRAALGLLTAVSRDRLGVLVLEDLHWADGGTLALLHYLCSSSDQSRLMIVGTFRSTELGPDHPLTALLASLWREQSVSRFDLDGLLLEEVTELCRAMAGPGADDDSVAQIAQSVHDETSGNAFFACELLRHITDAGGIPPGGSRESRPPSSQWELPPSLYEVIFQRVRHLGIKTERMLMLAAVLGDSFRPTTLAAVAETEEHEVVEVVEAARTAAILTDDGTDGSFTFGHALIRRALYGDIPATRRRQLHARVAAVLEKADSPPSLVAHHYLAADLGEAALISTERAGYAALEEMAPNDAAHWFSETVRLLHQLHPDAGRRRCDAMTQQGIALKLAGDPSHRQVLLDAGRLAGEVSDAGRMAIAALANTRGYYSAAGLRDQERLDALTDSLRALGGSDPVLRARLLATLCSESVFGATLDERRAMARDAKTAAAQAGDARTTLETNNLVVESLRFPTELAERMDDTAVSLDLAEQLGDPSELFWSLGHRMRTLFEAGHVEEAELLFERMAEVSGRLGQPVMQWLTMFTAAKWALLRGEADTGEQLAEAALVFGSDIGQPDALNYYATQISHARWQQGRLIEILELIEQGRRDNPGIPAYGGALARAYCQSGRLDEAASLLGASTARHFAELPEDLLWTYGMVAFAEAAICLRHSDAAAVLYGQLEPFADQVSYLGTTCEGPIAHYLGGLATVLDDRAGAERHLRAALDFADRARSPFFRCKSLIETGRLGILTGAGSQAAASLEAACALAEAEGYRAERLAATELLATVGSG